MSIDDPAWFIEHGPTWEWSWARTYARFAPHHYVIRGRSVTPADYDRVFKMIFAHGAPAKFWKRTNIELHLPDFEMGFGPKATRRTVRGWRFWAMTNHIEETGVINAAPIADVYGVQDAPRTETGTWTVYDALSPDYDSRYTRPSDLAENLVVWRRIGAHFAGDDGQYLPCTLDIGCGTGLALDLKITTPDRYTGVDPSRGMLNQLVWKQTHPPVPVLPRLIPASIEQALASGDLEPPYDLVCALFGTGSYLSPAAVRELPGLVGPGGLLLLMHYDGEYLPDYHHGVYPVHYQTSRKAAADLPGASVDRIGEFQTVQVAA